jgi:hypothetical protein
LKTNLRKHSSEISHSKLRLVIHPPPDKTATAFMAGPHITVRELEVPRSLVTGWLNVNRSKLRKATRETMKIYPAESGLLAISLCLIEFVTESWRTMLLRNAVTPSPIVIIWRTGPQCESGEWTAIDLPGSPTMITGGLGSAPVSFHSLLWLSLITLDWDSLDDRKRWG